MVTTIINKGDKIKFINRIDGYRTKCPDILVIDEIYEVIEVGDDYFDGKYLIILVNNNRLVVDCIGYTYSGYIDRFEIIGKEGIKNSNVI